jgi:hypothetical protein
MVHASEEARSIEDVKAASGLLHISNRADLPVFTQFACYNKLILAVSSLKKIKPVKKNQESLLRSTVQETELHASKVWVCTLQKYTMLVKNKILDYISSLMSTTELASCIVCVCVCARA